MGSLGFKDRRDNANGSADEKDEKAYPASNNTDKNDDQEHDADDKLMIIYFHNKVSKEFSKKYC